MNITLEQEAKTYLDNVGIKRLLIDMAPDMTNIGCGCGKTKKYYTPYVRELKSSEDYKAHLHIEVEGIELLISKKAQQAAREKVTVRLEKNFFLKSLALDGIDFIVE